MKKIVNWLAVCLLLIMGVTGCGFFKTIVEDPFIGNWIGLVKVPGMGKALLRVNIESADNERYHVHATAENFQPKKEEGKPVSPQKSVHLAEGSGNEFYGTAGKRYTAAEPDDAAESYTE